MVRIPPLATRGVVMALLVVIFFPCRSPSIQTLDDQESHGNLDRAADFPYL